MDEFDARILRALQANARMSLNELASLVGLSPTPVGRRLRHLEEAGIIEGYSAVLNEAALGFGVSVFVSVQLDKQVDEALEIFENAIQSFPEVVDCWLMTGNRDYLLRIVTTDLSAFERFLVGKMTKVEGVSSIESSIPLRRVKTGLSRCV
ncbi:MULTISPECIES: Lrp/AsnC family transcriptional regulator [Stappiaceae]|uniref:Lrp/AsnC family transcriptional regulator n=1 Tax=Roseibium polysiphoniae TaxID=2571221 RepID=A0A944CCE4_9HYPH|nr:MULTISPECIES: Lrp/AsnC family transcriptional regulator [Stappiaceae]MBD8876209.1 Lrp/AsnC family transcriptional regulator [Roseibium polysiphoniae]MBS8260429.1 Lrp/AsnC family transcriptional regulator [Roseibium polysiphoniae]